MPDRKTRPSSRVYLSSSLTSRPIGRGAGRPLPFADALAVAFLCAPLRASLDSRSVTARSLSVGGSFQARSASMVNEPDQPWQGQQRARTEKLAGDGLGS